MLAAAANVLEFFHFAERVGTGVVGDAVEATAGPAVDRDVETIERKEQPLGGGDLEIEVFDRRWLVAADLRGRDAEQAIALLVAANQPAVGINSDADPRAELFFRHVVNAPDLEARQDGERVRLPLL